MGVGWMGCAACWDVVGRRRQRSRNANTQTMAVRGLLSQAKKVLVNKFYCQLAHKPTALPQPAGTLQESGGKIRKFQIVNS